LPSMAAPVHYFLSVGATRVCFPRPAGWNFGALFIFAVL
jgi:hypothetical protein